jgi:hypothetical protein
LVVEQGVVFWRFAKAMGNSDKGLFLRSEDIVIAN